MKKGNRANDKSIRKWAIGGIAVLLVMIITLGSPVMTQVKAAEFRGKLAQSINSQDDGVIELRYEDKIRIVKPYDASWLYAKLMNYSDGAVPALEQEPNGESMSFSFPDGAELIIGGVDSERTGRKGREALFVEYKDNSGFRYAFFNDFVYFDGFRDEFLGE